MRIALIDDQADLLDVLSSFLEEEGFETVCFNFVDDVFQTFPKYQFDLAITDLMMVKNNWKDVVSTIGLTPMLIITGWPNAAENFAKGFTVLQKPFTFEGLLSNIQKLTSGDMKNITIYE